MKHNILTNIKSLAIIILMMVMGLNVAWAEDSDAENQNHIVFRTEAESITGITSVDNANASNGKLGYTGSTDTYVTVTHLNAGHYTIFWRGINDSDTPLNGYIKFGDNIVYSFGIEEGINVTGNSSVLIVPDGGADVLLSCEGSETSGLDWIYIVASAPQVTFIETTPSDILGHNGQRFTVDADGTMKIDGGEEQPCIKGEQYYAKASVEVWNDISEHQTFTTEYDKDKPWAVWCYQDGYEDGGVKPDGTKVTAIIDGLGEQYNVLMVHGARSQTITDLCPNIAKADLVAVAEMMTGGTSGVNLAPSFGELINNTNVLNFKVFQYSSARWNWSKGGIEKISPSQVFVTPKSRTLQVFDGVNFNDDGTIDLWDDPDNLDHIQAVKDPWVNPSTITTTPKYPDYFVVEENGSYTFNPDYTLLTADGTSTSTQGKTESVLHFYNTNPSNPIDGKTYVGFGLSINDYTHYNSNVTTIISNIGKMIKAGTLLNADIKTIENPVITDNKDGSATITCSTKSATIYYSTEKANADDIIAEGKTTTNGTTKKFQATGESVTVYSVAKYGDITSTVATCTIKANNTRYITRTIASDETEATGDTITLTCSAGQTITVPYNQTYKKDGYSVKKWKDASTGKEYSAGESITVDQDLVLEAEWVANTHKITDLKNEEDRTVVFHFLHKDGAAWMKGTTGVFVGQLHFSNGDFIDVACEYTGRFNNTEGKASVKSGTIFSFPAVYGMTVSNTSGSLSGEEESTATYTISSDTESDESLSVTYPALYTIKANIQNMTGDISNDKAAKMTIPSAPKNTDGKFPKDMEIQVNIVPTYPYAFYYMDGLSDEEQAKVQYNYTRNEHQSPDGEYNYADITDANKNINYGGSYTLTVTGDQTIYAYVKRLDTYSVNVEATPFRSGTISLPDDRSSYVENNIITITATPKVGYKFVKWVDKDGNDLTATETGVVRNVDNTNMTLNLLVNETSADNTYMAKFEVSGTRMGTLTNDLSTVPEGTITEGFPTSETNTTIAIPKYYTLYNKGYTLKEWKVTEPEALKGQAFPVGTSVPFTTITAVTAQPNFTQNTTDFNYRTTTADITWDFRTANYAQKMAFGKNTKFYYSTHATINQDAEGNNGVVIDVPLTIETGAKGSVNNQSIDDWCTIGEGTKISIPSGKGATFTLASRSKITSTNIDGNILTDYDLVTQSGVDVYLYRYTTQSDSTSVILTIGKDYSYYKYIRAQLPSADNAMVNLSTNDNAMGSIDMTAAKVSNAVNAGNTTKTKVTGGYQVALGNYVTISAYRKNMYEFDHWEVEGKTVTDGDTYAIVTNPVSTDLNAVNATISFYVTSYTTNVKAIFKARPTYQVTFSTGSATLGLAPDAIVVEEGGSFSIPSCNQTLYKEGQTLKAWKNAAGTIYNWGQENISITSDITLTPIFEPDEYTLVDIAEGETATATWNLAQADGAYNINYNDNSGVYVCQMTYNEKTIDVPLKITSPSVNAKITNQTNDNYCSIAKDVVMNVPTSPGCKIYLATYQPLQTRLTSTSIAGATSTSGVRTAEKYVSDFTATVTYIGDSCSQDITFAGDAQAFDYVKVTYCHITTIDKPTLTSVKYGTTALDDTSLATLNTDRAISGIEISPNDDDALNSVTAECSSVTDIENTIVITQPSLNDPVATIAIRTPGGVLISTYKIEYNIQKPSSNGLILDSIYVDGYKAVRKTYKNENNEDYVVYEVESSNLVNPTGVAAMYFNRHMNAKTVEGGDVASLHGGSPYPGTDDGIHGAFYDAISVEGGKPANMLYWNIEQGKIYDFTLNPGIFSDVYGNAYNDSVHVKFSTMATSISVTKKKFDFVVTDAYSSEYVQKNAGSRPATKRLVDDYVIARLDSAHIAHGTIDSAIVAANKAPGTDRFYIFVPNGEYQLTGDTIFAKIDTYQNKDNTALKKTDFNNGMTSLKRGNVSLIGQSQTGCVLWNNPYYAGDAYTATLDLNAGSDYYLQDLTLDDRFDEDNVKIGNDSKVYALALYDRSSRTVMKNVTVQAYEGTYRSDASSTADKKQRSYYEDCKFVGTIGFVYGSGDNWWDNCTLQLRKRQSMNFAITAPNHPATSQWGYVFNNCTIDAEERSNANKRFTLGQATGGSPAVAYLNTKMNVQPIDAGWKQANSEASSMLLRLQEYNSMDITGSVIDISSLRNYSLCNAASGSLDPVMSATKAATYTKRSVLGGSEGYDPTLFTAQRDSVKNVKFDEYTLTWDADNEAMCYFIFRSGTEDGEYQFYAMTEENSYDLEHEADAEGYYIIRAANQRGGLGTATSPVQYSKPEEYKLSFNVLYTETTDNTIKNVGWSTICLPYNAKVPTVNNNGDSIWVYAATKIQNDSIVMKRVSHISTGKGYVVKAKGLSESFTFTFRSSSVDAEEDTYLNGNPSLRYPKSAYNINCYTLAYKPNISGIGFYKFTGSTLACNRAWLDVDTYTDQNKSSSAPTTLVTKAKNGIKFVFEDNAIEDIPTGIKTVSSGIDSATGGIYELDGKRVNTPVKNNIYIINGKKMLYKAEH